MTPKITISHKIYDDKNDQYDKTPSIFLILEPIKAMQNRKTKTLTLPLGNKSLNYNSNLHRKYLFN